MFLKNIESFINKLLESKYKYLLFFLLLIILLFIFYEFFLFLSYSIINNSDNASILLEAYSFTKGNILLHGWSLSKDNFYFTDLPFYVLFTIILGKNHLIMHYAPAFIYSLIMVSSLYLVSVNFDIRKKLISIPLILVLIGMPSIFLFGIALMGPIHVGTVLFLIISIIFLDRFYKDKQKYISLFIFFILLSLSIFSDPMAIYVGLLPILFVSIINLIINKNYYKDGFIILSTLLSYIFSKILYFIISFFHGFVMINGEKTSLVFAHLSEIGHNAYLAFYFISKYMSSYIYGTTLNTDTGLNNLLHFFLLLSFFIGIYIIFKKYKEYFSNDIILSITGVCALFNILAFTFSYIPEANSIVFNQYSSRYFIPFFFFAAIFISRFLSYYIQNIKNYGIYILVVFTLFLGLYYHKIIRIKTIDNTPSEQVSIWLEQHKLDYGYGSFSSSNIITANSNGRIKIRPIEISNNNNKIIPLNWLSDSSWYKNNKNKYIFYIYNDFYTGGINKDLLIRDFGKYSQFYQVGRYGIYVWKYNLTKFV